MIRFFLSGALLLSATASFAQEEQGDWIEIMNTDQGSVLFARFSELFDFRAEDSIRTIWIKGDHSKDPSVRFRRTMAEYHFDCARKKYKNGTVMLYFPDGTNRDVNPEHSYSSVIPETIVEGIFRWACRTYKP